MDRSKLTMIISFVALGLLVLSMPIGWWISTTAGVVVRWIGVAVAVVYFIMRHKLLKDS